MTTHELKTWPQYFTAMWDGLKLFEARRAVDRTFVLGDMLRLREFIPCSGCEGVGSFVERQHGPFPALGLPRKPCSTCNGSKGDYTGREMMAEVTYVMEGGKFGVEVDHVVMGVKVTTKKATS